MEDREKLKQALYTLAVLSNVAQERERKLRRQAEQLMGMAAQEEKLRARIRELEGREEHVGR